MSLLAEYINNSHLVLVSGRKGQRGGGVMKESRKIWKGGGEREGGKKRGEGVEGRGGGMKESRKIWKGGGERERGEGRVLKGGLKI